MSGNSRHALLPNGFFETNAGARYIKAVRRLAEQPEDTDALLEASAITSRSMATEDASTVRSLLDQCRRVESETRSGLDDEIDASDNDLDELRRAKQEVVRKLTLAEETAKGVADRKSRLNYEQKELGSALMDRFLTLTVGDEINAALND